MAGPMHPDEVPIDAALVRRLLAAQAPHLAAQPVHVVEPWGTANAIFRLGDDLVVRLPRIRAAKHQVSLEATWLPRLGPALPIAVPEPVATGEPDVDYPFRWAIHRWIPGVAASLDRIDDAERFASDLAATVAALRWFPTDGAPTARNRARPLHEFDRDAREAIHRARHLIDAEAATEVWDRALDAPPHRGRPTWVHADLEGNCVVSGGRLRGLVDWGSACAGDPAVDVQVVWSPLFTSRSHRTFLEVLDVDDSTLERSRGAAIHQACSALPYYLETYPLIVQRSKHRLTELGVAVRDVHG